MLLQRIFLVILFSLKVISPQFNHDWLLYWSLPRLSVQYYDCLLLESTWYCRRPTNFSISRISTLSCPEKNIRLFSELSTLNISVEKLIQWSIPIDVAQSYAYYLSLNFSARAKDQRNKFVCNCTNNRFGVNCEYQSSNIKSTPAIILKNQLTVSKNVAFFDQWCLIDVTCNMGSSCLDWRYVCDGIEHCQFGEDELECERLEENECNVNEYRCRNGMCIPHEWFFDSEFDCQDESDEHRLERWINARKKCRLSPYNVDCAEQFCSSEQPFSCGDGECLRWQHIYDQEDGCSNQRDVFHRCEMRIKRTFSTIENHGSCIPFIPIDKNLTEDNECTKAFRRIFNRKKEPTELFEKYCDAYFDFPQYSFISPNVYSRYNKTIFEISNYSMIYTTSKPHYYCFNGTITCNGMITTLNQSFCLSPLDISNQYNQWPFRYIACSSPFANLQPSYTTNSSKLWRCQSNQRLISKWRINDGHIDCFNGEDEFMFVNKSINRPYRYQCSSSIPIQYVSTNQLGDGEWNCSNGEDELNCIKSQSYFFLENRCDHKKEFFCITFDFIHDLENYRPCIHYTRR